MKLTYTIHEKPYWCDYPLTNKNTDNCFHLRNGLIQDREDCKHCLYANTEYEEKIEDK